jgi:hypothetical protein
MSAGREAWLATVARRPKLWGEWMKDDDAHFTSDLTREHADIIVSGVGAA